MYSPTIDSVVVNSAVTQITITGSGFEPASSAPSVRFNGSVLSLVSYSNTSIVATLPGGLASGTYLLEVQNANLFTSPTRFSVAITVPVQSSVGYGGALSSTIYGTAKNVLVGTSSVIIPAVGTDSSNGQFTDTGPQNFSIVTLWLATPLAGSANLNFAFTNLTTSASIGGGVIFPGGFHGSVNVLPGSITVNSEDFIAIVLSLSSGSLVIPSIQWTL